MLLRKTKRGRALWFPVDNWYLPLALKVLPALAAASVPRDYSTIVVTLVKVL